MNLTLLLMPLIGGYVFLSSWNFTKFKVTSDSGYRLFFKSAFLGMILMVFTKLILSTIGECVSVEFIRKLVVPTGFNLESVLAMTLGILLPYPLNLFFNAELHARNAAIDRGNQLFLIVRESLVNIELIEISMANGKVYIGFPALGMKLGDEYLKIVPYASGYRDVETKVLKITSKYHEIDYGIPKKLYVSIKVDEIISVRISYPEVFEI